MIVTHTTLNHFFIHCIYAQFSLLSMISRLQPHPSSVEAGSNGKPHHNLMRIGAKQNFSSDYHYILFDWFLNFSLKWPPWRPRAGGG